ncbi:hypothetical protein ACSAZL_20985 [Methanosarcina sp. T3]|uniref:hypothetical protein n=1 Tax=Methanosarcina sp. T3 TaxID=3439062 RepID=UPI003F854C91
MQEKSKSVIGVVIALAVLYYALPLFYETFNYYPPMKEDMPHGRTVQVWSTLTNQRVTLNADIPSIPVNQLPLYQGKSSSNAFNVSFINSSKSYNEGSNNTGLPGEIYFLVSDNEITESGFNLTSSAADPEPLQIISFQTVDFNDPGKYIIQQVRNRNFVTQKGNLPMFSLGRTRITDVKFVYFNGFDTYPYRYEGQTTYYPAWEIKVETSNYGDEVLLIRAF